MARFRPPLKLKQINRTKMAALLANSTQYKVADFLGVSQMTVSRRMRALGLKFDARGRANVLKGPKHSVVMKRKFATGELQSYWKGKKVPADLVERRASKLRGRAAWNSGLKKIKITNCETCEKDFEHAPRRQRRFCSRTCAATHMSAQYSDGRYLGSRNPNFGNGAALKASWKSGDFSGRPLSDSSRGKGGRFNGRWMRSSWEIAFAKFLNLHKISWSYEPRRFILKSGKQYTPDFYLPDFDLWIEIKGFWWPKAREKFNQFLTEHPNTKIVVIGEQIWLQPLNVFKRLISTKKGKRKSI